MVLRAVRLIVGVPGRDQGIDDARQFVCRGREFGDWLLTQPQIDGGFPRPWAPGSGAVVDPSAASSYNPVPFLVLLSQETGDSRYFKSAERATDFVWMGRQSRWKRIWRCLTLRRTPSGSIVPGPRRTMRKPITTFGMSPCLPMRTINCRNEKGVPTYGGSDHHDRLHFSGCLHLLRCVDSYAKLAPWAGDSHYLAVATLPLHGIKNMTAVPGSTYDLKGLEWQQEH